MALARKPYVVLDAEILSSSVWAESATVRLVWITLLILCDTEGYVGAALPGIARAAGVTLEEAQEAIERLQQPDPHSRTKSNDGRRLEVAERGWKVLNFIEHLDRLSSEKAKSRDRMRRWRRRKKGVTSVTCDVTNHAGNREKGIGNREQTPTDTSTDSAPVGAVPASWAREACDDWIERFGGTAPGSRIGAGLKPLVTRLGWETVRAAWRNYLAQAEGKFANPQTFANTFGEWVRGPVVGDGTALVRVAPPAQHSKAAALDRKVASLTRGGGS